MQWHLVQSIRRVQPIRRDALSPSAASSSDGREAHFEDSAT
jgi:hypothetical protein